MIRRAPLTQLLAVPCLMALSACGPMPWVRHRAVLDFIVAESAKSEYQAYLSTDMEGTSVENLQGERVALSEAQKACEEFECEWWEYKDEKRVLSVMHIKGTERLRWVGYHMRFEKNADGWVAKAEFLGAERH